MGEKTSIQWTSATWNPIRGCSRVSEGCRNCYAERVASRFWRKGAAYEGLARPTINGPRWTGEVRFVESALDLPLRWKRPRRIFVNSMSDLFHEKVPDAWRDRIFSVMECAAHHTYQVLTKRPAIMLRYVTESLWKPPLAHLWLGVSVEDQATADERIPLLLQTSAAVRWVSYEPALGPVDFEKWLPWRNAHGEIAFERESRRTLLNWLVVGGESGPGARPFDLAWARSAIAQCRAAGVPVFVKQLGSDPCDCLIHGARGSAITGGQGMKGVVLRDRKGGDPSEWPEDLRVREWPK